MSCQSPGTRQGFALLAILWVVALVAGLSAGILAVAGSAVAASRNRVSLTAAAWEAEGCAERARAAIDGALAGERRGATDGLAWRFMDTIVAVVRFSPVCRVSARAAGSALDLNAATRDQVTTTLVAAGFAASFADSFAAAALDWRDADSVERRLGAEAPWYRARGLPPRNAPFAHRDELLLVRGGDRISAAQGLFDVEPGRLPIDHIPQPLVAILPGFTPELGTLFRERHERRDRSGTLTELDLRLSAWARDSLRARLADLVAVATLDPDAWVLKSTATAGEPPITAVFELRLERAGTRAAVVRRRVWP